MAIAGSGTSAYWITFLDGGLKIVPTTTQRSLCVSPVDAVVELRKGGAVIVAGGDMTRLRQLLTEGEE